MQGKSPSNKAFAVAIGGAWILRSAARSPSGLVDAVYELTRFGNNFTGGNNTQRNFRFPSRILEQPHYCPNTKPVAHLSIATVDRPGPKLTFA